MNRIGNMLIGAAVGAVIVGGSWLITAKTHSGDLATVGGKTITRSQFESNMETTYGTGTLAQLIVNQLITDGANKNKITASKQEIASSLQNYEAQNNMTDQQLQQELSQNHMTLDQFEQLQITPEILLNKLAELNVKVTDAQIQQYYDKNKSSLATPEEVTASHILVSSQDLANQIYQKLQGGANFADLAKQYSIDTQTKDQGGSLGTFPKGQMVPQFDSVAFSLKPGTYSKPVQTQYGWHIIMVTAHTPAKTPALADVKQQITDTLKQQQAKPAQQVITDLAKEFPIKILNSKYAQVKDLIENPPNQAAAPDASAPSPDNAAPVPSTNDTNAAGSSTNAAGNATNAATNSAAH